MRIDLTTLLNGRVDKLAVSESFVPDPTDDTMPLLPADMTLTGPVSVEGMIAQGSGYMSFDAVVSAPYATRCDRCLADIEGKVEFPFRRFLVLPGRTGGLLEDDGTDPDELLVIRDSYLEADAAIMEEVALELPIYHLCREDCPGLCPRCGKRLADGDCGCGSKKDVDPRLAILQKLLDNSEKE